MNESVRDRGAERSAKLACERHANRQSKSLVLVGDEEVDWTGRMSAASRRS
jgi:hypothetical protein